MQIIRTEVLGTTAYDGKPIRRVRFCGEGGECVTVDMGALDEVDTDEASLIRAKAILVQTATFPHAVNDYDAKSNGNFDDVAVASVGNQDGAVYVFEYRDGETTRRIPNSTMPSLEAARSEAVRCAVDLLVDLQPGTDDLSGWLVRVFNQQGDLLFTIDVADAEAARQTVE